MKMGAASAKKPALVLAGPERAPGGRLVPGANGYSRHAGLACVGAGLIFLVGSLLDVAILWGFQRGAGPAWEFAALSTTIEGTPRIALGAALMAAGLWVRGSTSLLMYRTIGLIMLLTGIAGAIIGGMLLSDYFILRRDVDAAQRVLFNSAALKVLALSGLHAFVLIPIGVLGMRRPRN